MIQGVLAQLPPEMRGQVLVVGASLLIGVAIALAVAARARRANRRRRAHGGRALSADELAVVRAAGADVREVTETGLAEARELLRQKEWERQQVGLEVARYGRGMTRAHCRTHDRWCKHPERGPHPPGGHDFEAAPPEWKPGAGSPL
jgi:hypothetical protein